MKVETPLLVPVLAALPVCACMTILGLPAFGHGHATAFRTLFFIACLAWLMPLALLQRAGWRREWHWLPTVLLLLVATYAMSVVNALLGQRLAIELGLETGYRWRDLFRGLDSCWLALTSFCAMHAVAVYYLSLQQASLRLAQAQTAAREAELRALRLQINPHFLFNSLNAISALVSNQSNREANRMLACVSDFLRATLAHDGRHEHTLAEELSLLDAYLEIEKARLVENAIRHGIAPLTEPGRLDIRVERAGARLLLDVRNDGRRPPQAGAGGIGLANVAQRLRHLYGDAQQVDAGWGEDGRFGVRIALPLRLVGAAA